MFKILNRGVETDLSNQLQEFITEGGYSPEEAIAGLASAIVDLSLMTDDASTALDEAVDILYEDEDDFDDNDSVTETDEGD